MDEHDAVGKRGESIFTSQIMNFCGRPAPYFNPLYLGEKAGALDFLVEALGISARTPLFFVQVKATRLGYTRRQTNRRLRVKISAGMVRGMLRYPLPTYLVGIDEPNERSYLVGVTEAISRGVSSLSTSNLIDASVLRRLWEEVRDHWQDRDDRLTYSSFPN